MQKKNLRTEHLELICLLNERSATFKVSTINAKESIGSVFLYDDGGIDPQVSEVYFMEVYNSVAEYAKEQGFNNPHLWF
ncbi:MAG: hypothetical protein J6A04_01170 [Clostridia bacterium]|nr:hypothetical protein [Clostridia bacterium]